MMTFKEGRGDERQGEKLNQLGIFRDRQESISSKQFIEFVLALVVVVWY